MRLALRLHPNSLSFAATQLEVEVSRPRNSTLLLSYAVTGRMRDLQLPPVVATTRADELWRHTCFEAFVAAADAPGYHEFNFSPSHDWAIYRFSAYREGMSPAEIGRDPEISVRQGDDGLELQSVVHLGHLADLRDARHVRIALAAVIEDENGRLSYWGLRHPPGKPDFHHPNGFALKVSCS